MLISIRTTASCVQTASSGDRDRIQQGSPPSLPYFTRRHLLATTFGGLLASHVSLPRDTAALPLAPLGSPAESVGGAKLTGLSPEEIRDILARNLREGQYFITGDLTPEIFADNCRFKDPTNDIVGLARYVRALGILFDASYSAVRLRDIQVTGPSTIEAEWTLGGYLKFPWHPRVEPFIGHTIYHLNDENLIAFQDQTWSISSSEALRETFTPTLGVKDDIVRMS